MVVNTLFTWLPKAMRTEMATTEMKARIKAYSTRVWPFLLFIRRNALLARVITLLIIVFSPPLNKKCSKFKNCDCHTSNLSVPMLMTLSTIISHANRKKRFLEIKYHDVKGCISYFA